LMKPNKRTHEDNNNPALPVAHMESLVSDESVAKEGTEGLDTRVTITVRSYRKLKHDPDGVSVKAVLDGIVRCGILPDDSTQEVKEVRFKSFIEKEEKTVIEIE